jgi:hypothetical protein
MLSPDVYRFTRSFARVARSAPTIRRPFSVVVAVLLAAISKSSRPTVGGFVEHHIVCSDVPGLTY